MHIVTLSFDDGLLQSTLKTAEIYEQYNLSACFNVLAEASRESFISQDPWQSKFKMGNFKTWNELQARGHEIMPHGFNHTNKATVPLEEAQKLIRNCLDIFKAELDEFEAHRCVFNFPYNASTPELEKWLSSVVGAFRTKGGCLNPLPHKGMKKLTTSGFGPGKCDAHLNEQIEKLLATPSGWLVYCAHGLEEEGWGPMGADFLDDLLNRLTKLESVKVLPAGKALQTCCIN